MSTSLLVEEVSVTHLNLGFRGKEITDIVINK